MIYSIYTTYDITYHIESIMLYIIHITYHIQIIYHRTRNGALPLQSAGLRNIRMQGMPIRHFVCMWNFCKLQVVRRARCREGNSRTIDGAIIKT